jgi:hypothetical protein
MHARKEVRDFLIAKKMRYWRSVAKYPVIAPSCPTWRARKNYWHLWRKYPEIASKLGFTEFSVFDGS